MRHLISPLDFSVEELDKLLDLANDIENNPDKYADACKRKKQEKTSRLITVQCMRGQQYTL